MRLLIAVLAASCLFSAPAHAQSANPIMQHYRAYQTAFDAGDLPGADAAGAQALATAQAANDRRTAVLALNLASVRLLRGEPASAAELARTALNLAEQGAPGVDPDLARLILGRAALANDAGPEQLIAALETAQQARLPVGEIFDAAVDLGAWGFQHQAYESSALAWSIAEHYAEGSRFPRAFALGRAKVGRAATMVLADHQRRDGRGRIDADTAQEAFLLLAEANVILSPLALADAPGGDVTLGQQAYAEALAWRTMVRTILESERIRVPEYQAAEGDAADGLGEVQRPPLALTRPRCLVQPLPIGVEYPDEGERSGQMAASAMRIRVNEAGEVIDAQVLATIGAPYFTEVLQEARWRVRRRPDSEPNCRMEMSVIFPVSFRLAY